MLFAIYLKILTEPFFHIENGILKAKNAKIQSKPIGNENCVLVSLFCTGFKFNLEVATRTSSTQISVFLAISRAVERYLVIFNEH